MATKWKLLENEYRIDFFYYNTFVLHELNFEFRKLNSEIKKQSLSLSVKLKNWVMYGKNEYRHYMPIFPNRGLN